MSYLRVHLRHAYNLSALLTVHGSRQRAEMAIHKFARLIMEGKEIPVYGDGESRRDYAYVDDIISGVVPALQVNPPFEIINLGELVLEKALIPSGF